MNVDSSDLELMDVKLFKSRFATIESSCRLLLIYFDIFESCALYYIYYINNPSDFENRRMRKIDFQVN